MKLREDIDLERFFKKVRGCKGRVVFHTSEDDVLNMKSQLCLFVFAANHMQNSLAQDGELMCELASDWEQLKEFAA